jgi:ribosomal protein S18 acetylase RimI-like enzyme
MIIRKAERSDISAMLHLIQELAAYEKAPQEVTVDPAHFEASGFGPNPVWWAFVVEDEKQQGNPVVGFALYYIRYSTWKGQVMYLEDIIVTAEYRGKGIGKMLMDKLIEEAREKGFKRITWQVLEWNEPAIRFYKKYNAQFDPEWVNVILDLN